MVKNSTISQNILTKILATLDDKRFPIVIIIALIQIGYLLILIPGSTFDFRALTILPYVILLMILDLIFYNTQYTNVPFIAAGLADIFVMFSPYVGWTSSMIISPLMLVPLGILLLLIFLVVPTIRELKRLLEGKAITKVNKSGWILNGISLGFVIAATLFFIPQDRLYSIIASLLIVVYGVTMHRINNYSYYYIPFVFITWILLGILISGTWTGIGGFTSPGLLGTLCAASPGYLCSNPTLLTTGLLEFVFGQNTGFTEYNIQLACSAASNGIGYPSNSQAFNTINITGTAMGIWQQNISSRAATLTSGQTINIVSLPCYGSNGLIFRGQEIGTDFTGFIWLNYTNKTGTPNSINPWHTIKVATLSLKVL